MTKFTCSFSGHREMVDLDYFLLDRVIKNLINEGCYKFFCGMAKGFDLAAAESVLAQRKKGVQLVALVPCAEQSRYYSAVDKARYDRILRECDETITFSETYFKGCMQQRDRFLADNCDVLVCYLRKKSGGTYYTVSYARKKGVKIIEL